MYITRRGVTRTVLLTRRWAIKFPTLRSWRLFLCGLLANMSEAQFSAARWPELCPVVLHLPLGILIIMPRATMLTDTEWDVFDYAGFTQREDYHVPAEQKQDGFGWWHGKIVAIDYGS